VALHDRVRGVVPELASRDQLFGACSPSSVESCTRRCGESDLDAVAYTQGPGSQERCWGATVANSLAFGSESGRSACITSRDHLTFRLYLEKNAPRFPFVALTGFGGPHSTDAVAGVVTTRCWAKPWTTPRRSFRQDCETARARLSRGTGPCQARARGQDTIAFELPRPMLEQLEQRGDLNFSFMRPEDGGRNAHSRTLALDPQTRADVAAAFQEAVVDVPRREITRCDRTYGLDRLGRRGGRRSNLRLRALLDAAGSCGKFGGLPGKWNSAPTTAR